MSNHRYNGDPNQYLGGHGHSPHHSNQHPHHLNNGRVNGHSHGGMGQHHSPGSSAAAAVSNMSLMDNVMDSVHRRGSYNTAAAMTNHGHNHSSFAYPSHGHPISNLNSHPHVQSLMHAQHSSSSLSTLSPSLNPGRPSNSSKSPTTQKNITVHDHDVLSGRGVNIAQHPGNQRFRTLITTFRDQEYCTTYSAGEKRAVALQIIKHIKDLEPPGRFLKRDGRGQGSRGLNGPWDELSERESIKKTCQALRDCNRQDRQGYAKGVAAPGDVIKVVQEVGHVPAKERAAAAATAIANEATTSALNAIQVAASTNSTSIARADAGNDAASSVSTSSNKRHREEANSGNEVMDNSNTGGGGGNFSSPSSSYYSAQQFHQTDPRFPPGSSSAANVLANSNYHMGAPQGGLHYQPQHNPYTTLQQQAHHHQYQSSQFPVNIAPYGNASGGHPGGHPGFPNAPAPSAGSSYYPSASSNASDYLMPMAAAQAPIPYQDALLTAMASSSAAGNSHHQQHLHNSNFYQSSDPYNNNSNNHLPNASVNQDHQLIKKQRTEDTDPSTGPSEQSPINATNIGPIKEETDQNGKNGESDNVNSRSPIVQNGGHHGNLRNDASVSAHSSSDGEGGNNNRPDVRIAPEQGIEHSVVDNSELFHNVDTRNIVNSNNENSGRIDGTGGNSGGGNNNNNVDSSWVTGPNNPSSLENNDRFHDALNGF